MALFTDNVEDEELGIFYSSAYKDLWINRIEDPLTNTFICV